MAARDLLLFGIAVILASGFVVVYDLLKHGGLETTALFYLGIFVGLGLAFAGLLASPSAD
jgi:hypothetical protein